MYISECVPGDEQDAIRHYYPNVGICECDYREVVTLCSTGKKCFQSFNDTVYTQAGCALEE